MPQWSRDPDAIRACYPDERWVGTCSREAAALLLRYDHHTVWVGGRRALLLTFEVSFTYAHGHPAAPPTVQAMVDHLTLVPAGRGDRQA